MPQMRLEPDFAWLPAALRGFAHPQAARNISGVVPFRAGGVDLLAVVTDEGQQVAIVPLGVENADRFDTAFIDLGALVRDLDEHDGDAALPEDAELDLEGVGVDGDVLWISGSLSLKRRRLRRGEDRRADALRRLARIQRASGKGLDHSERVYRLRVWVDDRIRAELLDSRRVRKRLLKLDLLEPFADLPSKDNGLDVEGAAHVGEHFWFGLRGPVLRGQALMVRTGSDLRDPEPFPLDLGGSGIRGLTWGRSTHLGEGFLLISGPTLTAPAPFALWHWVPPADEGLGVLRKIMALRPPTADAKFEAVFLWGEQVRLLLDGVEGGGTSLLKVTFPD